MSEQTKLDQLKAMQEPVAKNRAALHSLTDEIKAKREAFEASIADLVTQQEAQKQVCDGDEAAFRALALEVHEETGDKRFLDVLIQDRKVIEEYDKAAVETWVRTFHPGWMVPDFKLLEKVALNEIKGVETPLVVAIKKTVAVDMDKVGVKKEK